MPLEPAALWRDETGTPFSVRHQDVYHARQGALEQARHVFLNGNGLPGRWRGKASFTVCETGFGLGRNFLALWQAWQEDPRRSGRLHVLAFEAHPFSRKDLAAASRELPDSLRPLAERLAQSWPALLPGVHRLEFDSGSVTLTLIFGRIEHTAREAQAGVDAFFLDGFSPTKNPEMWSPALFGQLVRIARPGATAATWCANGAVRRDLRDAGFLVRKTPGLGGKWAMTQAVLRPGLGRGTAAQESGPILIVGAGPAGAGMAHALALRGCEVLVADPSLSAGRGASHRGHLAAAITPLVSRDDDQRARLSRAGVLRALNRWQDLPQPARPRRTGTVELMRDADHERERQLTLATLQFPQEWVSWLEPAELSGRVGFTLDRPGICFADGQLVQPEPLLDALLDHPRIECRGVRIEQLQADGDAWLARSSDGQLIAAATVVLANAGEAAKLLSTCMDLSQLPKLKAGWRVAGQVSYLRADLARHDPATVVSAEGYWLPQVQGLNVAGSTYVLDAASTQVTAPGHRAIAQQVAQTLGVTPEQVQSWLGRPDGWAGWRAVVAGRLPVFGPVPKAPGLWLACAYGSRGLSWAALAGDLLGASLRGEPQPLERSLQKAVAPR